MLLCRLVDRRQRFNAVLRPGFLAALLMLVIQFLLGMYVNLFVTIPTNHPGARPPEYFSGVAQSVFWAITQSGLLFLILHAAFGLVIVVGAAVLLAQGIQSRSRSLIMTTSVGAFGVLVAALNGGSFLNYNEDFSSMIMAAGFAVAMVSYVFGLNVTAQSPSVSATR
jgi:hypothetical protein